MLSAQLINTLESTKVVNIETTILINNVYAKPRIAPVPNQAKTSAAIIVVMLPSKTATEAR